MATTAAQSTDHYTIARAARALELTPAEVRTLIAVGELRARRGRVHVGDLLAYVHTHQTEV